MNEIKTWRQGSFVDQARYRSWTGEQKQNADDCEKLNVRPGPTENAICTCSRPQDAKWIAQRLNLASILEQMTYDFAMGKTNGEEIKTLVLKNCEYTQPEIKG